MMSVTVNLARKKTEVLAEKKRKNCIACCTGRYSTLNWLCSCAQTNEKQNPTLSVGMIMKQLFYQQY
jgi:hypothetical protein